MPAGFQSLRYLHGQYTGKWTVTTPGVPQCVRGGRQRWQNKRHRILRELGQGFDGRGDGLAGQAVITMAA